MNLFNTEFGSCPTCDHYYEALGDVLTISYNQGKKLAKELEEHKKTCKAGE